MPRALALGAVCALLVFGCGAPDKLSREDGRRLALAAERLDDAVDTHEVLRTSRAEARRLRSGVRAIVARGAFESQRLDEFGRAALGELRMLVPSLVVVDRDDVPVRLDRPAMRAFLRFALSDPERAVGGTARRAVDAIERVIDDSEADAGTEIPREGRVAAGDRTVGRLLRRLDGDLGPIFPGLARRLGRTRDDL